MPDGRLIYRHWFPNDDLGDVPGRCHDLLGEVIPKDRAEFGADGLDGHLEIRPNIVPTFETALVYWDLSNVSSCSVTGGNGDAWSGASSGASGQETSPILEPTTYTLACEGLDGSTITESVTVQVVPIFQEL